jgi:hypothetical protein
VEGYVVVCVLFSPDFETAVRLSASVSEKVTDRMATCTFTRRPTPGIRSVFLLPADPSPLIPID